MCLVKKGPVKSELLWQRSHLITVALHCHTTDSNTHKL